MEGDWVDIKADPFATEPQTLPLRITVPAQEKSTKKAAPSGPQDDLALYEWQRTEATKKLAKASPIFFVDLPSSLNEVYYDHIPGEHRQRYTCRKCQRFMSTVGSLAIVTDTGALVPLFWDEENLSGLPSVFHRAVQAVACLFKQSKVYKEYKITESTKKAGDEEKGGFKHMHFDFPEQRLRQAEIAGFSSINNKEAAAMLTKLLNEYEIDTLRRTYTILNENKLPYADNHKAGAKWLLDLVKDNKIKGDDIQRHNLTYRYAASAFIGCLKQLRSGALAVLLADVKANRSWKSVQLQWAKVCSPENYMRPSERPKEGNIAAAERLFEILELTKEDMRRRFLTHDDLPDDIYIWKVKKNKKPAGGKVLGGIKPRELKNTKAVDEPSTPITFLNFVNQILPTAKKVEYRLGSSDFLFFYITGLEGSKPLMQWHNERNLVSWYTHTRPSPVQNHNLKPNDWNSVGCIIPFPHLWDGVPETVTFPLAGENDEKAWKYYHKKEGFRYLFCLEGVKDKPGELCLFPEMLKSELHAVRSTIERYSKNGKIEKPDVSAKWVGGTKIGRSDVGRCKHELRVTKNDGEIGLYDIQLFE